MNRGIGEPTIERNENGEITRVSVCFGPHYFIDIMPHEETGELAVYMGATHHGFGAHAHEVGGELEQIVEQVMKNHPDISFRTVFVFLRSEKSRDHNITVREGSKIIYRFTAKGEVEMSVSFERFPVELEVTRVVISTSNPEMQVYLITGVMNANQLETLDKRIPITSKFEVGEDKWAIAALTNHKKLCEVYASFTDSAKSWRGAYYVLTNVFVEKCREFCK